MTVLLLTHVPMLYAVLPTSASCAFVQSCRLGQHRPISKGYPDGIVLVGGSGAKTLVDQPVSDWFLKAASDNSDAFTKLKLYAQVCRHNLGMRLLLSVAFLTPHHPRLLTPRSSFITTCGTARVSR